MWLQDLLVQMDSAKHPSPTLTQTHNYTHTHMQRRIGSKAIHAGTREHTCLEMEANVPANSVCQNRYSWRCNLEVISLFEREKAKEALRY